MIRTIVTEMDVEIPAELKEEVIMVILGQSENKIQENFPVLPIGFPVLIHVFGAIPRLHFNRSSFQPDFRLAVAGQIQDESISMEVNGKFGQVGLVLFPSATYYLFHKKGLFFRNKWRNANQVSPIPTKLLLQKLSTVTPPGEQIPLLFDYLLHLKQNALPPVNWLDETLQNIILENGIIGQKELARSALLSQRHFRRKFKNIIGVPPKYFCKVIQLNQVFKLLKNRDRTALSYLALNCGYYDHSHFIKDFKFFIGNNPSAFLKGEHQFIRQYLGR